MDRAERCGQEARAGRRRRESSLGLAVRPFLGYRRGHVLPDWPEPSGLRGVNRQDLIADPYGCWKEKRNGPS